jgi:hypothetical protein
VHDSDVYSGISDEFFSINTDLFTPYKPIVKIFNVNKYSQSFIVFFSLFFTLTRLFGSNWVSSDLLIQVQLGIKDCLLRFGSLLDCSKYKLV